MKKYKRTIKIRATLCMFFSIICITLIILAKFGGLANIQFIAQNRNFTSFQIGIITSLGFIAIMYSVKYLRALKNNTKLQLLNNDENDERKKLIRQKAGMPLLLITSWMMMFIGVIVGYFNNIVFITLITAGFIQVMVGNLVKLYYSKKL